MSAELQHTLVPPDAYRIGAEHAMLMCELHAAVAVCVFDDTQGVGGLVHPRYVASAGERLLELTDNTLSSDLLLPDRFCKELRRLGARKTSWRVRLLAHVPPCAQSEDHAATVLDLLKAYFADSRLPIECEEIRRDAAIVLRFDAREGRFWIHGSAGNASARLRAAPLTA